MSQDRLYGKATRSSVGGPASWVGQVLRESPGQGSVSQVDGDSDMAAACVCMLDEGRAQQRAIASASTSFWEKAAPAALVLLPDNLIPPHVSLASFDLLP